MNNSHSPYSVCSRRFQEVVKIMYVECTFLAHTHTHTHTHTHKHTQAPKAAKKKGKVSLAAKAVGKASRRDYDDYGDELGAEFDDFM